MARRGWGARYDIPEELAGLTLAEKLLIARMSVTVAIHHLAHGGFASTGHVATSPKPADAMAEALPGFPSDVTIIRVRRGAAIGDAKKQSRLYTVRRKREWAHSTGRILKTITTQTLL